MAHAGGRPSMYTPELAKRICDVISTNPISLKKICAKYPELPHYDTINEWVRTFSEFSVQYYKAKDFQADAAADSVWDAILDVDLDKDAIAKVNAQLKFTQWQNARLAPKRWRESTQTESKVDVNVHEADLKALK